MTRALHTTVALWLFVASAALSQVDPRVETFAPATEQQLSIALLPAMTQGGAEALSFAARCLDTSPREGLISLTWQPAAVRGSAQRVDVTKFREAFDVSRFDASGRLEADLDAIGLQAPEPGINYYWRVLTETPSGWISSPVERFEAPVCPSDGPAFERSESGE